MSRKPPPSPLVERKMDKGKGKQIPPHPSDRFDDGEVDRYIDGGLSSALEDALTTPLSPPSIASSLDSSFHRPSPISRPPLAHRQPTLRPTAPRLLSDLTRSTLPTASLTYAAAQHGSPKRRSASHSSAQQGESSSMAWRSSSPVPYEDAFPDLDPTTGLPIGISSDSHDDAPPLHLQRTITGILASRRNSNASESMFPSFTLPKVNVGLPSLPNIPGLPGRKSAEMDTGRRSFSSTASNDDWGSWTGWWSGNKGKVDRTLTEDDQADTVEEEREKHRRKYRTPKNPVVFCHGLLGFDYLGPASLPPLQISHWRGIREVLESNGAEVMIARVPATASIADRAATLEELIAAKYPGREVNLIGHSMGGLDCRYLISQIQPKSFKPVSLTTISTPHRGSPFADYVIDNVIGRDRLPSLLSILEAMKLPQSGDGSAFNALGTKSMRMFNSEVINRDDVQYYSWGASFEPGLLDTFRWPHSVILAKEGPNDGLVSVTSAKWGEYRGTLLGVNHLDLVGWVNTVRYYFSGWTGNPIAFKPATFYLEVADYLAEQGY